MLAERVTQWKDEYIRQGVVMGREEGREEGLSIGREEGLSLALHTLLQSRLGTMPENVRKALEGVSNTQRLCELTLVAARVASYEDFLASLTQRENNGARGASAQ